MYQKSTSSLFAASLVLSLATASMPAVSADLTRIWDNGGPTNNWTDADNWAPNTGGGGPANTASNNFFVTIPDNFTVNYDKAGDSDISGLVLNNNVHLSLQPGSNLTIIQTAPLA